MGRRSSFATRKSSSAFERLRKPATTGFPSLAKARAVSNPSPELQPEIKTQDIVTSFRERNLGYSRGVRIQATGMRMEFI